jgi:hypothetical protein
MRLVLSPISEYNFQVVQSRTAEYVCMDLAQKYCRWSVDTKYTTMAGTLRMKAYYELKRYSPWLIRQQFLMAFIDTSFLAGKMAAYNRKEHLRTTSRLKNIRSEKTMHSDGTPNE